MTVINIYTSEETKKKLVKISKREHRSLSRQIMMVVEKWLKRRESEKNK